MSLNYIPMSTPNVASIRKEILVNIEDPVADRSLLDPNVDGDEEAINNDNEGQKLMDPDAHDYTGADIYQASLKESAGIYQLPSDIYASKDKTDLSAGNSNPSLFDDEGSTKQSDILDPDVSNYTPKEVYGSLVYDKDDVYPSDFDEYYNESAMKAAERNVLDDEEFGIPRLRKYPLHDRKHVKFAIRMFSHCKDPKDRAELAKRIFAKIEEYDMDVKIGKGNPLYDYAPKSLQESIVSLSAEIPMNGVDETSFDGKECVDEKKSEHLRLAGLTANVLNFQPALGKALGNMKEYEFLNYFYPDTKGMKFQIRLYSVLGGMCNHPEVWEHYNLRPPLCTDNTRPLTRPTNNGKAEQLQEDIDLYYNNSQNWFHENANDISHVMYCLTLYSVLGMILLNPEFNMNMLDEYWMGVLTDWGMLVQTTYDEMMESDSSTDTFKKCQELWDLCWNPTENPQDEAVVTNNMINFASTMVSQKLDTDLNESGGELLDKVKCNEYILSQLGLDANDVYLLPDTMEYPIFNQSSIRMAMDNILTIPKENDIRAEYVKNLNRKYKEFGCTFSISVDHPYAPYADQNIIDHMNRILVEGDTVVDDQGTSDAGNPDNAPWYVRVDVNGNVGQNLLQNKELGPNDEKNTALNIDPTEPIIN